jgi:phage gp36-like protein
VRDHSHLQPFSRRQGASEDRETNYKNAVRYLEKVSEGKATPGVQPVPDSAGDGDYTGGSRVSARDKIFGPDTMEKY